MGKRRTMNADPISEFDRFDNSDCAILIVDKESGQDFSRPPSPAFLKWAEAERERLRKFGFNLDGTPIKPPDEDAK